MKKLSLLIGGVLFAGILSAQTINSERPFTIEGQVSLGGVVPGKVYAPAVRLRYFFNDKVALRGTIGYTGMIDKNNFYENPTDNSGNQGTYRSSVGSWNGALGFEIHTDGIINKNGLKVVSPYFAIDLSYGMRNYTIDGDNANNEKYINNFTLDVERSVRKFGAAAFAGLDVNLSTRFYIGAEAGVAFSAYQVEAGKATSNLNGLIKESTFDEINSLSPMDLQAAIRLGFRF